MSENNPNIVNIQQASNIYKPELTPLEELTQYSITGQSQILREQMLADQFILNKDIKESLVNYNFDLRYIEKYNFLPKIKIEDEILNSLTILSNCNDQK